MFLLMDYLALVTIIIHKFMDCNLYSHLFMDKHGSIVDRLQLLMDGRDKYPWGLSIGLGKGVIDGMTRTGSIPGGDTLSAIRRCENARIDWILDGRGAPYSVSVMTSDEEAEEFLRDLLVEPDWNITIVTDSKSIALVLEQAGSFEVKDGKTPAGEQQFRPIPYTVLEILVGNIGRRTMELVRAHRYVSLAYAEEGVMAALAHGKIGTWRLLQRPDAILKDAQRIPATDPIYSKFDQQDLFPAEAISAKRLEHLLRLEAAAKALAVLADKPAGVQ
jgi:hypothetical protein